MTAARARTAANVIYAQIQRFGHWVTGPAVIAGALLYFVALALVERVRTAWRRMRGARPRLLWGPTPMLNIKYWSEAMRAIGYESRTCVDYNMPATTPDHWDVRREDFLEDGRFSERLRSYAMFAWALRHGDVFLRYFDGGFLRGTALDWWECPLLRLAGKRLVVSPFGGDIAVPEYLGEMREATLAHYPHLAEQAPEITRRVLHSLKWADVSIRNYQVGFLPSYRRRLADAVGDRHGALESPGRALRCGRARSGCHGAARAEPPGNQGHRSPRAGRERTAERGPDDRPADPRGPPECGDPRSAGERRHRRRPVP